MLNFVTNCAALWHHIYRYLRYFHYLMFPDGRFELPDLDGKFPSFPCVV